MYYILYVFISYVILGRLINPHIFSRGKTEYINQPNLTHWRYKQFALSVFVLFLEEYWIIILKH
jgi:hypothetical protein